MAILTDWLENLNNDLQAGLAGYLCLTTNGQQPPETTQHDYPKEIYTTPTVIRVCWDHTPTAQEVNDAGAIVAAFDPATATASQQLDAALNEYTRINLVKNSSRWLTLTQPQRDAIDGRIDELANMVPIA